MGKKEPDLDSLLMIQDIMDILYSINRIKDNSYDPSLKRQLNNMPPADRAQNIIKYISKNSDNETRKNADILINILQNINEVSYNRNRCNRGNRDNISNINHRNNKNSERRNSSSNYRNYPARGDNNFMEKIKNFLKLLNDE